MSGAILVVEDNEDNITLAAYLLRAGGHEPVLARDGAEGLRLALATHPAVVLLDIRMPGMDGYEVAAAMRGDRSLDGTSIVAVTASVMAGDRERIAAAHFDGYIRKPIDPMTFVTEVERWLPGAGRTAGTTGGTTWHPS